MKRGLVLAGVVLAVLGLVMATLPARLVLPRVLPATIEFEGVHGTVWSGGAEAVRVDGRQRGRLQWDWQPGAFVRLEPAWNVALRDGDLHLSGRARPGRGRSVLSDLRFEMPAARLAEFQPLLGQLAPRGQLEGRLERVVVEAGRVVEVAGRIHWRNAAFAGLVHESLGVVRVTATGARARIESLEPADISLRGHGVLEGGVWDFDLLLRAGPGRPGLKSTLARLGEPQPDGSVLLRLRL